MLLLYSLGEVIKQNTLLKYNSTITTFRVPLKLFGNSILCFQPKMYNEFKSTSINMFHSF